MSASLAPTPAGTPFGADFVITTDELSRRPARSADIAAENRVLQRLADAMADDPHRVLQEVVDSAREICQAGSAGISLLDTEQAGAPAQFRWVATSGSLSHPVCEVLLAPFHRGQEAIGTVWIASHTETHQFDQEDARIIKSLSRFAAAAVQVISTAGANDEALKRSEQRHRAMFEASPECVKIVAADGTLLQINAAGLQMLEVHDERTVAGCSVYDAVVPEDRQRFREFNERICRGESASLTFDIISCRGTRRTMETTAVPLPDGSGGFCQLAVSRDVTQRRRAEAALAAELKDTRLLRDIAARLIGEDSASALFDEILAAAMTITQADAGTIQLLDHESQTLSFLAFHGFDDLMRSRFERVDATRGSPCGAAPGRGERVFMRFDDPDAQDRDGSNALHLRAGMRCAQTTPLVSRSGRSLGMFSTHWHAHRQLSERELRCLDLLGRQAADLIERTQAQTALRSSEQQLREADRRKDEFIAVLAHELRNPLVPIRTGIELLKKAADQPDLLNTVRPMMERQVGHVVRLIDDLLDVSRITSGKIELQRQKVTISSVVGSAIEANRAAIAGAGLELAIYYDNPDRIVEVDPTRFSQVISNLLHNSTKFTPQGGKVSIAVSTEVVNLSAVPELVLKVSDTGIGIEQEHLARVFDLFTQAHRGGYGRHAGLGIGLALARRLVELHGGSIGVHSEGRDQGSVFTVRLPALASVVHNEPGGRSAERSLHGLRTLVVDDNADAADSTAMLIAQLGGDVRVAYEGHQALATLAEFPASLVLLDIGMPELDGYETCRRIRERFGSNVCIVAVTGWGQDQDRKLSAQAGFDAHLTKPVDPSQLVAVASAVRDGAAKALCELTSPARQSAGKTCGS
jgi:PAS domain S-box-containing protein